MLCKKTFRFVICLLQHLHYFLIDLSCCSLSTVHNGSSVQITVLNRFQSDQSELFAHTILCDHGTCNLGCLLNIIRSTCSNCIKHNLFRSTSTKHSDKHCFQLFLGIQELLFLRCLHYISESTHGSRYDSNLLYRL